MENDSPLFPINQNIEVPQDLFAKVMSGIITERKLQIRRRLFGIFILLLASAAAIIPAGQAFWLDVTNSGLNLYLTLAFSDLGAILNNWQDFSLTLLESLPVVSAAIMLGVIIVILLALKFAVQYCAKIFPSSLLFKTTN